MEAKDYRRVPGMLALAAAAEQIGPDKGFQVTVENAVHIAYFHLRAMVFNEPVRVKYV